jgi:hypothetical protein
LSGSFNALFDQTRYRPEGNGQSANPQDAASPTLADAWSYNANALSDWINAQRAKSSQMGLWNDQTGLPTAAGLVNAAGQYGNALMMGTTAPGEAIAVSSRNIPGQAPIVRFRNDASAISDTLPEVAEGFTRLWRGNRPGEIGKNPQFTNDLPGIALPFREAYGGHISYVDVPTTNLKDYVSTSGAAPDAEFYLPPEWAAKAQTVRVAPKEQ